MNNTTIAQMLIPSKKIQCQTIIVNAVNSGKPFV